jgi:two-component system, sensor histidine kinase
MPKQGPTPRRPLILNVNDDDGSLYVVSVILRKAGLDVIEAHGGREALALSDEHDPDVIVLDIKLPDLNGLEVCRLLRASPKTASIKVLHTSATFTSLDNKVQSLSGGADGYLTQPFEAEELLATVQSLLRLRETERELRAVAEQLREADRRKNEFLAMLAHELRNPLSAISTSLAVLEADDASAQVQLHARDVLARQTRHLARLVDDLLDVARVTQGKIELKCEVTDLGALLSRTVDSARNTRTGPRSQSLELTLPAALVSVHGDPTRLEQVFTNLIDNASKYTQSGGHIQVALELAQVPTGSVARVRVRDDGSGIVPELLPNVFALFAQADVPMVRSMGGLGIGLTLVQTLVQLHAGTVTASSAGPGRGSEFEVSLPLASVSVVEQTAVPSRSNDETKRRVLLVEDNADALEVLADLLSMWGHEVRAVPDGLSGVDTALSMRPDVALIDIGLPGIDGYEVARRIRADPNGRALKLVALTGYGAPEQRERASQAGFDLHITKPVQPAGLAKLLQDMPFALAKA